MEIKWTMAVVFLMAHTGVISGAPEVKILRDGDSVDISCHVLNAGSIVLWFRVLESSGLDYIAAVSSVNPVVKKEGTSFSSFSASKISSHILVLRQFNKDQDSGVYGCMSLPKANEMKFGPVTRLAPAAEKPTPTPKTTTAKPEARQTSPPCTCSTPTDPDNSMQCSLLILAPLAGGCGLLLLVLVCTVLYCNRIRTRRCPHHYKRKPRMVAPGKQLMTNAHI